MLTLQKPLARTYALGIIADALDRFREAGVAYCHWKSNEHLGAALEGATDLDLLVDRRASTRTAELLSAAGFKRFLAAPDRGYPGVEDYLGLDPATGRMVHIHLHHQLTLGERYLKGYRLPWESVVLETRLSSDLGPVDIADPAVELVLLIVRLALKLRTRDLIDARLGRGKPYVRGGALRELRWLAERAEPARLREIATRLVGEDAARRIEPMLTATPTPRELAAFRDAVTPSLANYRTYGAVEATLLRWRREWASFRARLARRFPQRPRPRGRIVPAGGVVIALVGPDGAGKSSLVKELTKSLSWKLDVVPMYFGSGDGPVSLLRRPFGWAAQLRRSVRGGRKAATSAPAKVARTSDEDRPALLRSSGPALVWHAARALALAHERRKRLADVRRARNLGMVVLCDRYPQLQIPAYTDGLRLTHWLDHPSALRRALARYEQAAYESADAYPPDLVIKLRVTPEIARQRKPDMSIAHLRRRGEAIASLRYPAATRVVEIDTDGPFEDVLLRVKHTAWSCLG